MDNKNILIVGGAGFVGSNLAHYIIENYNPAKIVIVDNLLSSEEINVPHDARVDFLNDSINSEDVLNKIPRNINFIFHLSCYHGNQSSIHDPLSDHENNTLTSLKLFNEIKDFSKLEKVVYSAAGCAVAEKTFDEPSATSEDAPVSLFHDSPYSISKLVGEMYGNYFYSRHGLPFVKARFQNVYGPREILGAGKWRGTSHSVWRNVIPNFIFKAMNNESLPLDNGGLGSRDFIFVEDIVRGLVSCALLGNPGEAYNLASGAETSIKDLADLINELTKNKQPHDMKEPRDWDNSGKRFGSTEKSMKELSFKTHYDLKEGLKKTVAWTQQDKIQSVIKSNFQRHVKNLPELKKYF